MNRQKASGKGASSLFALVTGAMGGEAEGQGEPMMVGAFKSGEIWNDVYVLPPEQGKLRQVKNSSYKI